MAPPPPPPPPQRLPPYLTPELVEEILLRASPEDPALLVRASLACKPWRRLLCDPAFRRRYLAFHRTTTPPLLGFLHNHWPSPPYTRGDGGGDNDDDGGVIPRFVATTTHSPFPKQPFCAAGWCVVDCRHGRVLFESSNTNSLVLVVWDPATGIRKWLPKAPTRCASSYAAAVFCALQGHGCDHLECCSGPFFVVLVESGLWCSVKVHLYSSEAGTWITSHSPPPLGSGFIVNSNRSTVVGNGIYFVSRGSRDQILRYNLGNNRVSFIQTPAEITGGFLLMPVEDGLLGIGTIVLGTRLCLWSRNVHPDVVAGAGWVQCRIIQLWGLIPCSYDLEVIGSADDFGIIFVATDAGVFTIDLKSSHARKVVGEAVKYFKIFPFMNFYTPGSRLC